MAAQVVHIYVVFDRVANSVGSFATLHGSDVAAVRSYLDAASDPKGMLFKFPQDYDLLRIGTIESDNSVTPESIVVLGGAALAVQLSDLKKE